MKSAIYSLLALLLVGNAYAAELIPETHVRLLVVNGAETSSSTNPVEIEPGLNQIAVKVYKTFGRGSNKKVFESDPFLLMFNAPAQDVSILPPDLNSYDQAQRHFKSRPEVKLISDKTELSYEYAKIEGKKGFLPYGDLEGIIADYNMKNGILIGDAEVSSQEKQSNHFVPSLEQLKSWYPNMAESEREAFKVWVVSQ